MTRRIGLKRLLWRVFLALLLVSVLAFLALGPRPTSPAAKGRLHIEYWEKWTGLEGQQMQQIVDAFNDTVGKEKGIWVNLVSMSQIDRKTLISTAAGVPPDVAGLWDTQVLQFGSMDALEPLDDYAKQYGLTPELYKRVFYDGCKYHGRLCALPSTVWCVALLWNKEIFQQKAQKLRDAGLDPDRPPRTIAELDKYAAAIDTWEIRGARRHLSVTGFIPLEPGSFTNEYAYWFGGRIVDPSGTRLLFTTPPFVATYNWIRGYSQRLGKDSLAEFRSGFSSGATGLFDTPQNPFLVGWNAMEQQGPWIGAFIEHLKPSMNRWHVPPDQLRREQDFEQVGIGMTQDQVGVLLGPGERVSDSSGQTLHWPAGIKDIYVTFVDGRVSSKEARLLPARQRQQYCQWGAAPFPTAVPGLDNVTYAGMDVWVIPRTSRHKREAFEFIAFASRQAQIEKLSSLHCNLSPLANESEQYLRNHPNPYVDVYEALASSPNALPLPPLSNWPQIGDELGQVAERSYLLQGTTAQILATAQERAQRELNKALNVPENTNLVATSANAQ